MLDSKSMLFIKFSNTIDMKYTSINNSIFAFLLILTIGTVSCKKDFLDTVPNTSIDQAEAFSTPAKILAQVNNLYGRLQNQNLYGGRLIVFNEQRGDEFGQNDGNAATGSAVWNQNVASSNEYINDVWANAYSAINNANILIEKLESSTVIPDSTIKQYTAEAKFVRALSYLNLVQTYAKPYNIDKSAPGVPLRLVAVTTAGSSDLARSSVEEVYTQIIKDLDDAEFWLPNSYKTSYLNKTRAQKSTAIALKTRIYLHQAQYQKVIEEASKIVPNFSPYFYSSGTLSLQLENNIATVFGGSYTGNEAILSMPFANSTTETPASQYSLAFNYLGQPIIFLANNGIVANIALQDPSDARAALVGLDAANHKVLKKFALTTAPFRDYVPVIRYAEVLLNYAEAAAKIGDQTKSIDLLKSVRNRSNPEFVFPSDDLQFPDNIITTIITERRIELLGEGFRLQDLQRHGKTLPAKIGSIGTAPEVLPTAKNYIWPIPSGELSANKLCIPN